MCLEKHEKKKWFLDEKDYAFSSSSKWIKFDCESSGTKSI